MKTISTRLFVFIWAVVFGLAVMVVRQPVPDIRSADDIFGAVCMLELDISENGIRSLREQSRRAVAAEVRIGTNTFTAWIHLKGRGTFRPIGDKPSFTIKFREPCGFFGLSKVHLNNSMDDPSYIQEELGSELFSSVGIPAPRVGHARVKLNGRDLGLYVFKEGFGPEFLAQHFGNSDGTLYDSELVETGNDPAAELLGAANDSEPQARWYRLNESLNVDAFITFMAVEVMLCHWDGYSTAANNVRIYHDPVTGRFNFIPTGMDQIFGNPFYPACPDMTGRLARSIMEIPEGRARYKDELKRLANSFDGPSVVKRALEIAERLKSAMPRREYKELRENVNELCERIVTRDAYLDREVVRFASFPDYDAK